MMFDLLAARHEAGHGVVGAFLGMRHSLIVRKDGSGQANWDPGAVDALHPFDRAVLALSGNVAECMAIDGNLKRAVQDTLDKDSYDAVMLRLALSELAPEEWKYGRHGPAVEAAKTAQTIIRENRAEFERLTAELQEDGIGQVRMGQRTPASRPAARGVDYSSNLAAARALLAGGQVAGVSELRNLASKAASENPKLAQLLEATIARREGREVKRVTEFSIGGPAKVILQGEVR